MTTLTQTPGKSPLELENEILRARVAKLEEMILSLRSERGLIIKWFESLRYHVAAGSLIAQPNYIAEAVYGARDQNR